MYKDFKKHSDTEVINAMRIIQEHCAYFHAGKSPFHDQEYGGGPNCHYCILGRKRKTHKIKGKKTEYTIIDEEASCMLVDKYGKCIPWLWDIPEVEDITLF
ncbi:hypothetical protein [Anaerovibrio sp. RM50]|uniref:hypothetical protein n=1 Tax=Anaerovibrio sp. RM50 TaxID=1200557 RepID=UPI0004845070|nr:hypothetical protein [Anaerovibrio sp. RM50]